MSSNYKTSTSSRNSSSNSSSNASSNSNAPKPQSLIASRIRTNTGSLTPDYYIRYISKYK
jgi:hypothetical protein